MRILITAGGTSEHIDQVRSITNHSSGRLGKTISEAFLAADATVDYVTTKQAVSPVENTQLTTYYIETTAELLATLEALMHENRYDAVIHSMAVSDFTPAFSLSEEAFAEELDSLLTNAPIDGASLTKKLFSTDKEAAEKKISSSTEHLVIVLEKNPKIISKIKAWQPDTQLVGFKLLVDVPKEELINVAKSSIIKNQADFILANDLTEVGAENHHGYLVAKDGSIQEAFTKKEIGELIVQAVTVGGK